MERASGHAGMALPTLCPPLFPSAMAEVEQERPVVWDLHLANSLVVLPPFEQVTLGKELCQDFHPTAGAGG